MSTANTSAKTIMVVEDDYSIRETFRSALESEGYQVITAENGLDGLVKIRELSEKPCLVLLDMMMPVMNGREFLDVILADSFLAPIPVVIVSASTSKADAGGAAAFVKKPVDLEVLLKLVEQYIRCSA